MVPSRSRPPAAFLALLVTASIVVGAPWAALAAPAPGRPSVYIGGVRDTGQFLPDTTVLLRVADRIGRVRDFIDTYYSSFAQYRPASDSLGRVEFLNTMITKEIMALVAAAAQRPLSFEDRAVLRENRERVLSDVAYQRLVTDSVRVSEDEVRREFEQYKYQQRLRMIRCADRATAGRVRGALLAKRLAWKEAVRRHHRALPGEPADGELGWVARDAFDPATGRALYELRPGEISEMMPDARGFRVYQAVERRPVAPQLYAVARRSILRQLQTERAAARAERIRAQVARGIDLQHDSTNIAWAAPRFENEPLVERGGPNEMVVNLDRPLPEFEPSDTARVLARHRDGRFTLGDFMHAYSELNPIQRPPVSDVDAFHHYVDLMILEPYMARLAEQRGLDRDTLALARFARREEELRVEHLYQDSVASHVWIDPAERRKYYQENLAQFLTYAKVRYAAIMRPTQAGAESLLARLRAAEKAQDILRADSLAGVMSGSIQERMENEHGPYQKVLFEELRPGQARAEGPDRAGRWVVLQSLEFDPGRQLSYVEAEHYVDDALREGKSEALLQAFIARHRPRYAIESRPEWVMRVRLVDPARAE